MDNRLLVPILAFNFVFIVYQYFFNWLDSFTWGGLFLGLLLGAVAAGVAFGAMTALKR
jgi:hypothetical protein